MFNRLSKVLKKMQIYYQMKPRWSKWNKIIGKNQISVVDRAQALEPGSPGLCIF